MFFNYLFKLRVLSRYYSTKRLTNVEKNSFLVPQNLHEVIIGLMLGDCFIHKHPKGVNACLHFEQGLIHEAYIMHLYELFKSFCSSAPKTSNR